MAFNIEVPGEAAPLTPQQVYLALQSAGSSQQLSIQTGTQQLQTWETQKGYYSLLQAVYLDKSLPSEIRYLAIIQLKNGIDKYWRKTATNAISAEEKAAMRSNILEGGIGEVENNLALQNALVLAKVVRIDFPLEWPDVLTSLIKILRAANHSNQLHLRRGMLMLLQVIKELSTARLRTSQTRLQSVTPEIVFLLSEIYNEKVAIWLSFLNGNGEDEGGAMDAMENSLFAIKIPRRLLISGYEYPHHSTDVQQLWEHSQLQFGQFLDMTTREPPIIVSPAKDFVEKHLLQFSKLHTLMSNRHPASFALLPSSLDLVRAYWGLVAKFGESYGSETQDFSAKALRKDDSMKDARPVMEKLCLKGLNIMRACVKMVFSPAQSFKYRSAEVKQEQQDAAALVKSQLLTDQLVGEMASTIVTKFFIFRQVDLEEWEEDPDEWKIREEGGGDTWEFEVRPCSEKLFMDLVINYKHLLVEPLLSFFQSVAGTGQSNVVTKDAVYTAMGLSASVVHHSFDFDSFLTSTLVNDVQQTGPGYKVLRRRIAILLGQWITIKISEANRPLVYQIFQHLLKTEDETNDQVVRVTAARQFKAVVDDFSFDGEKFLPYAPDILGRIMALIQEVENTETKMAILDTIRMIALRLESSISQFSDQIVSILPGLWEASGEEHLLKQAILTLLSTIVTAMKEQSQRYHPMVLPLIQRAVEVGSEMQVYLMDEALDLWCTILAQTPAPATPEIISLAESAFPLLEIGSDTLRSVLAIVESYILLAPEAMLGNVVRLRILSYMTSLLGVTKRELAGLVATIVENMIRAAEALGGSNGVTQIAKDLHECGYTERVFEGLRDAWEAHQTTGPGRRYPKLDDVVETDYFTILARIALADPSVFVSIMGSVGNVDEVWRWLNTEWFRHFDCMANIDRQKLSCLALTRLLELPPPMTPVIFERLQDYFAMWTSVIGEMIGGRDDGGDNLIWLPSEGNEYEGPEDVRKRLHSASDPVHTIHTYDFVKERLSQVVAVCGGEDAFQRDWAVNVDKDVLAGFQNLGTKTDQSSAFWRQQD
ncbi:ARM repeat-containing protein [Mollisia scopiformis]|uniref:ARM repeat-containing protein n=1 Tax=Mollisia scopiformis TaxID=149040 RepID=A0A194XWW5_MOLSC|nr:ARM repeat-containing protein [Mollisia scopiformis]KUJ24549.1 ARM repeat-containing protein [Mollisia scopiformis]